MLRMRLSKPSEQLKRHLPRTIRRTISHIILSTKRSHRIKRTLSPIRRLPNKTTTTVTRTMRRRTVTSELCNRLQLHLTRLRQRGSPTMHINQKRVNRRTQPIRSLPGRHNIKRSIRQIPKRLLNSRHLTPNTPDSLQRPYKMPRHIKRPRSINHRPRVLL